MNDSQSTSPQFKEALSLKSNDSTARIEQLIKESQNVHELSQPDLAIDDEIRLHNPKQAIERLKSEILTTHEKEASYQLAKLYQRLHESAMAAYYGGPKVLEETLLGLNLSPKEKSIIESVFATKKNEWFKLSERSFKKARNEQNPQIKLEELLFTAVLLRGYFWEDPLYQSCLIEAEAIGIYSELLYFLLEESIVQKEAWNELFELQVSHLFALAHKDPQTSVQHIDHCILLWSYWGQNEEQSAPRLLFFIEKKAFLASKELPLFKDRLFCYQMLNQNATDHVQALFHMVDAWISHPDCSREEKLVWIHEAKTLTEKTGVYGENSTEVLNEKALLLSGSQKELYYLYKQRGDYQQACNLIIEELADNKVPTWTNRMFLLDELYDIYYHQLGEIESAFWVLIAKQDEFSNSDDKNKIDETLCQILESLAEQTQNWPALLANYRRWAETKNVSAVFLLELGVLFAEKQQHYNEAIWAFRQSIHLEPDNQVARILLVDCLRAEKNSTELAQELEELVDRIPEQESIDFLKELGQLYEFEIGDMAKARRSYEELIQVQPSSQDAFYGLERLYRQGSLFENLKLLWSNQLSYLTDTEEKFSLLVELGDLSKNNLSSGEQALFYYKQAYTLKPHSDKIFARLSTLLKDSARYTDLSKLLEEKLDNTVELSPKLDLLFGLKELYLGPLANLEEAIKIQKQLVALLPQNDDLSIELAKLYHRNSNIFLGLATLEQITNPPPSGNQAVEFYRLMAGWAIEINDIEKACFSLKKAVLAAPEDKELLYELCELHQKLQDFSSASDLLLKITELPIDDGERADIYQKLAELHEKHLNDKLSSANFEEKAYFIRPQDTNLGCKVKDHLLEQNNYAGAKKVLDRLLQLYKMGQLRPMPKATDFGRWADEAAYICEIFGDIEGAKTLYKEAYVALPNDLKVLNRYGEFLLRLSDWDNAYKVYQIILGQSGEDNSFELLKILGKIKYCSKDLRSAQNLFEQALKVREQDVPTLKSLAFLAKAQSNFLALSTFLEKLYNYCDNDDEKFCIIEELADIYQKNLTQPDKALPLLSQLFTQRPSLRVEYKMLSCALELGDTARSVEILWNISNHIGDTKAELGLAKLATNLIKQTRNNQQIIPVLEAYFNLLKNKTNTPTDELLSSADELSGLYKAEKRLEQEETLIRTLQELAQSSSEKFTPSMLSRLESSLARHLIKKDEKIGAQEALERALKHEETLSDRLLLQRLYIQNDELNQAIHCTQRLIEQNPTEIPYYKTLLELYKKTNDLDASLRVCLVLKALKKQTVEEEKFISTGLSRSGRLLAQDKLARHWWKTFFGTSHQLASLFSIITKAVLSQTSYTDTGSFNENDQRIFKQTTDEHLPLGRYFYYANQVLPSLLNPGYYIIDQQLTKPYGISTIRKDGKISLVAAFNNRIEHQTGENDALLFNMLRLSAQAQEETLPLLWEQSEIERWMLACVSIGNQNSLPENEVSKAVLQYANQLKPYQPMIANILLAGPIKASDVINLRMAPDKAALTLTTDLAAALKSIELRFDSSEKTAAKNQLMAFFVSQPLTLLRTELGIALNND